MKTNMCKVKFRQSSKGDFVDEKTKDTHTFIQVFYAYSTEVIALD